MKKRLMKLGLFFGGLFTPLMAHALIITATVATIAVLGASYGIYKWVKSSDNGSFANIMQSFTSINDGCWFCPVFSHLFLAINNLTESLSHILIERGTQLLVLGFAFYILFKVLKAVISFGEINAKEFFTDMLMPILKCAVVLALFNGGMELFYKQVVNPLTSLSINFATEIISEDSMKTIGVNETKQLTSRGGQTQVTLACHVNNSSTLKGAVFGPEVHDAIQCFLRTTSLSLMQYMAVGATFIHDSFRLSNGLSIFPMLGVGLCLFIGVFGIFLAFPFKLIDGMFRLMFVSALMPLWIIFWVLPQTRSYSQAAFKMFLNVMVTFVCLSVVLLMVLQILNTALGDLDDHFWELLIAGRTKEALTFIDWSKGTFFIMLAMTFLANALSQGADKFAQEFGGGGSLGLGDTLQSKTMAGISKVGSNIVAPTLKKGVGNIKDTVAAAPHALGFAYGRFHEVDKDTGETKRTWNPFRKEDLGTLAKAIPGVKTAKEVAKQWNEGYKKGLGAPETSKNVEKLADGSTKETVTKSYKDENGNITHKEVEEIIKNAKGELERKIQHRETFDPKTGVKTGSFDIETKFDAQQKVIEKKIEEKDAMGRLKAFSIQDQKGSKKTEFGYDGSGKLVAKKTTEKDEKGQKKAVTQEDLAKNTSKRTEYNDQGKESKIVTKEASGKTTTESNTYDASGEKLVSKKKEEKDAKGNVQVVTETEYNDKGQEAKVTKKEASGQTTITNHTYDATGNKTKFETVVVDAKGRSLEHSLVDLVKKIKTDFKTGTTSPWKP